MNINPLHEWNLAPRQAIELQKQLAYEVVTADEFAEPIKTVAGIDPGYDIKTAPRRCRCSELFRFTIN